MLWWSASRAQRQRNLDLRLTRRRSQSKPRAGVRRAPLRRRLLLLLLLPRPPPTACMRARAELLSMYDARYVDHRADEIAAFETLRERLLQEGMPSVVEIGSNRGDFLRGQAERVAPEPVLGIEWRAKQCALAEERLEARGVRNAHVLHGDAKLAIPSIFDAESLDAVFVLFPDPWWKSRHAHRRLLDPMFLRVLARRLRPKGALYVKSDVFDYLHQVRAAAEVSEALRPLPAERWPDERTWSLSTRERKCMQGAIPFGRGYYTRKPQFDAALPVAPEDRARYAVPEEVDATAVIKGAPPVDQNSGGRRR